MPPGTSRTASAVTPSRSTTGVSPPAAPPKPRSGTTRHGSSTPTPTCSWRSSTRTGAARASWPPDIGLYTSTGLQLPRAGLRDVGPDGAIGYVPDYQSGLGVTVRERDGREWRLSDGFVLDLGVLGGGRAIWQDAVTAKTIGLPPVTTITPRVWRPRAAFIRGEWWVTYWTAGQLVLHPFASPRGYRIRQGDDAFNHDVVGLGDSTARIAFATNAAETPGSVVVQDIDVATAPRVELAPTIAPPPAPEPPPTRPVRPPAQEPASLAGDVATARQAYPTPMTPAQLAALLNAVAWQHRAEGWGLLSKPAGNNCPAPSGVLVACDILVHRPSGLHFDVLGDAEGAARPSWGNAGPIDMSRFMAPVEPAGAGPSPDPDPEPPTPAPPAVDLSAVLSRLDALARQIADLRADVAEVREQVITIGSHPVVLPPMLFPEYSGKVLGQTITLRPRQ